MESGPCQLYSSGACPCLEGRFDTSGPPDRFLPCKSEGCRHQLRHHFFTYDNLALFGLSPPPSTAAKILASDENPESRQFTGASSPVAHRGGGIPGIEQERLGMVDRVNKLLERIRLLTPENPIDLATPARKLTTLPFPSLLPTLPRDRFAIDCNSNWGYMGREKFKELLRWVKKPMEDPDVGLWFYGTIGYGKSHLLAALVCYLVSTGSRVVYIPDCQVCLRNPVEYVRTAMLLAWGEDVVLQMQIMDLETKSDILQFFNDRAAEGCWVTFVIDQMNALEPTGKVAEPTDGAKSKASLETWLYECSSQHMTIVGLSADNTSYPRLQESQRKYLRVNAYGGLTKAEMKSWWERNGSVSLAGYTKPQIEDITGSIPLLLNGCVVNGEIDLSALPLTIVSEQVLQFMKEKYQEDQGAWCRYLEYWKYMKACMAHGVIPNDVRPKAIDQRYSFEEIVMGERIGSYTCGVAREAIAKGLRKFGGIPNDPQSFLKPLRGLVNNPSAAEFFAKRAAMAVIEERGLGVGKNVIPPTVVVPYLGDFPDISDIEGSPKLYFPLRFDPAIDGIIVSVGRGGKRCRLFPLRITVAKARTSLEEIFFSQWSHWINTLGFESVEVKYVWIVGSGYPFDIRVEERYCTRDGLGFRNPSYTRWAITLRDLSPQIFTELRYAQTRREGWVSYCHTLPCG